MKPKTKKHKTVCESKRKPPTSASSYSPTNENTSEYITMLLQKYLSRNPTRTFRDGQELKYWDAFIGWQKEIVRYFEEVKDYSGYPHLPAIWLDGYELYKAAPTVADQQFIANSAINYFVEALRHWKADADKLYPNQNRTHLPLG